MIAPEAFDLIKRCEGLRLRPYLCPAKVWTIGWGATRDLDGSRVNHTTPTLTRPEAERLLHRDLDAVEAAVARLVRVAISDRQCGALVSFTFNLGAGALQASTLLRRVNGGAWDDVPAQLLRWVHGAGKVLPGLVARRQAEAALWVSS